MLSKDVYIPFKSFIVRTPFAPLNFVSKLIKGDTLHNLRMVLNNSPALKEAIYIASPLLYYEMEKWLEGKTDTNKKALKKVEKLKESLLRYLFRMSTRCTPFGLFAGFSTGNIADETEIRLPEKKQNTRNTRLDMNYLCALATDLSKHKAIKTKLNFFPNTSIYKIGNQIRYIEYHYVSSHRVHQIVAVDNSEYLSRILDNAKFGDKIENLANLLVDDEITFEEALTFIDELIDSQLLVSQLEPSVTGDDFLLQIINFLSSLPNDNQINNIIERLKSISSDLNGLSKEKIGAPVNYYENIVEKLKTFPTKYDLKFLFQTDMVTATKKCTVNKTVTDGIIKGLEVLNKLNPYKYENNLSKFRKAFQERYEDEEVPLLQALDTETGIGYIQNLSGDVNPLIDDLRLPSKPAQIYDVKWSNVYTFLQQKYTAAIAAKSKTITITDEDIKDFPLNWNDMPETMAAMVQILHKNNDSQIFIKSIGGSSAANLIGRFCYADEKADKLVAEIIEKDERGNQQVVFAEIVHLPEARTGNILYRPVLRQYEIPYLAKPAVTSGNVINVDDLMISVRGNTIFLRSKKLNKIVIPRLTNAHNYSFNALPVYQFLCDMQTQNQRAGFSFNWGQIAEYADFLPRVVYQNIILSRATWNIKKSEIENILNEKDLDTRFEKFKSFKEKKNISDEVVLSDNDNELYLNLKSKTSVNILLNQVKNRPRFVLKEFLFNNKNLLVQGKEGGYVNEFVFAFYKNHNEN